MSIDPMRTDPRIGEIVAQFRLLARSTDAEARLQLVRLENADCRAC